MKSLLLVAGVVVAVMVVQALAEDGPGRDALRPELSSQRVLTIRLRGGEGPQGDHDYTILHGLVSNSDVIVSGTVKAVGKGEVTFVADRVLKGRLPDERRAVSVAEGEAEPIACMGPLAWTKGERACLFLKKTDSGFCVLYEGSGKQALPFKGYLGEDALKTVAEKGTLPSEMLAAIARKSGPRALRLAAYDLGAWNLAANKAEDGEDVLKLMKAPAIQKALAEFLVRASEAEAPKTGAAEDLLWAILYAVPDTLTALGSETAPKSGKPVLDAIASHLKTIRQGDREGALTRLTDMAGRRIAQAQDRRSRPAPPAPEKTPG